MSKSKKSPAKSPKKGSVAKVWALCDKMKGAARKDIVEACVKIGINENTAKTQVQAWKQASPSQRKAKQEPKESPSEKEAPRSMKKAA